MAEPTNPYNAQLGDGVHIPEDLIAIGEIPSRGLNGELVAVPAGSEGQVPTYQADGTLAPGDVSGTGALIAVNNLSDLEDAADARTNLGLGTAAEADTTDFDAAGAAATAQSNAISAATALVDDLSGVSNAATARTNLGLGTAATEDTGYDAGEIPIVSSGSPDGTKFLRDDGVWATPAGGGGGTQKYPIIVTAFEDVNFPTDPESEIGRFDSSGASFGPVIVTTSRGVRVPSGTDSGSPGYISLLASSSYHSSLRGLGYELIFTARIDGYDPGDDSIGFIGFHGDTADARTVGVLLEAGGSVTFAAGGLTEGVPAVDCSQWHTYRISVPASGEAPTLFIDGVETNTIELATVNSTNLATVFIKNTYGTTGTGTGGPQVQNFALYAAV